jgi:amidase
MLAAMQVSDLDATAAAELVRSGQASPRELVDRAIARIEQHNAELGPVIIPLYDAARRAADRPPHGPPGPFHGVPILIKDIIATVGGVLQCGGLLPLRQAGYTAPNTSYLVSALERARVI